MRCQDLFSFLVVKNKKLTEVIEKYKKKKYRGWECEPGQFSLQKMSLYDDNTQSHCNMDSCRFGGKKTILKKYVYIFTLMGIKIPIFIFGFR